MNPLDFINPGDLILDESFQEFVNGSKPESVEFWKAWILANPDKKAMVENAAGMVRALRDAKKLNVPADKNDSLKQLMGYIDSEKPGSKKNIRTFRHVWTATAAVGLLLIGLSLLLNSLAVGRGKITDRSYNEVIVPLGEKAQIRLSDGTHVWINSASRLRYPVKFGENSREVTLEGEAYFDVTKRHGKNFVVNTRDVKVNVLGTAFNVKCYPGDQKTQTIVVRGLVRVEEINGNHKPVLIKPNEMATLQKEIQVNPGLSPGTSITVRSVDPENLVSWKDQMLVFNGETFEDLSIKMERWFNVNIRIDNDELKSQRFNGKFVHNETVYQVLEAIKVTTPIDYVVSKDTIVISGKQR